MTRNAHNATSVRRPADGFTLIELLMVISLIALLMMILMPAVFRTIEDGKAVAQRAFIYDLSVACKSYAKDHDDNAPAIVADPSSTGLASPTKLTGAQQLRLALVGCSLEGYTTPGTGTLYQKNSGVPENITNYSDLTVERKVYLKHLRDDQVLRHGSLPGVSGAGYDNDIQVFVANLFSPIRPMLYYRVRGGALFWGDNTAYTAAAAPADWTKCTTAVAKAAESFLIVWCGPDGEFFTGGDDHSSLARDWDLP